DGLRGRAVRGLTAVLIALDDASHAFAAGCAAARAVPAWSDRSKAQAGAPRTMEIGFLAPDGPVEDVKRIQEAADAIRMVGELVDMPASQLHTTAFVERAEAVAAEVGASCTVITGDALTERGFGGLAGVGRAASHPPALVHLRWAPEDAAGDRVAWVGKGIVYDTGGLSLKGKNDMPGMKGDMAGAAAVLGAFRAAARLGWKRPLDAVLCLAENSVGPDAIRPDDILHMYSGKTVEVNNTDAEGRLVLADGVAYAVAELEPQVIVDMATLTGAQLLATGRRHAAIVCNDEALEQRAIVAGRASGDLVHALPYAPEIFRDEFKSRVADLKNSVKDRMNAQSSCAGQFIAEHLGSYDKPWLHVDIAGPAEARERGTGYGVALLLELFAPGVEDEG
ncbi:MAG: leucyl aminopeptidase family protein, partial [Deltaproteobacteria bacterium]